MPSKWSDCSSVKVFVVFNKDFEFEVPASGYKVLSKFKSHAEEYAGNHQLVEDLHINDTGFLKSEEARYDEYIARLPKNLADIFTSSKTSVYFVMMSYENWRQSLEKLVKEGQVDEVVFTELVDQDFYMPFYEAEWEVTKRLQYEPYDFISVTLYNFLKNNYPAVKLSVIKKHSRLKLRSRIFARRYLLLALKIMLQGWQHVKAIKFNAKKGNTKPVVILSRGMGHSQYVIDYVKGFKDETELYVSDGLRTIGKNAGLLANCGLMDYADSLQNASLFTFIGSVANVLFILAKYNLLYRRKLKSLDKKYGICYSSAVAEMIIHYLETHVYVSNLERFVKRGEALPKVIITCEIYTQYTYFIAKLGREHNIKTIQLISVQMITGVLPQYFFCDKVLFNQRQVLLDFARNNPAIAPRCDYWGNLTFNETGNIYTRRDSAGKLTVIVFTQPVLDEENDFVILDCLVALKSVMPLEITVKPHPREKMEKFAKYVDEISIYPNTASLIDVVKRADLAIVKFSAVEHYLLNYGIPTLYCAFSQIAKSTIANIIDSGYEGVVFLANELRELIINFPGITAGYDKFRENEMLRRFENKGIHRFNETLVKYISE